MTKEDNNVEKLHEVIARLTAENGQWRKIVEETQCELRRRSSKASGLSLKGAAKTILDERDANFDRIELYREEMKKVLRLLLEDRITDAKKELNLFLFNNKN